MSGIGLPPGLDVSDDRVYLNRAQHCNGSKRAACEAAMCAVPNDKLRHARELVGFIRVVAKEENVFVIASAYIIAEGLAKEMDVQNVVPPLRDAVMWAVMQFSGFTYKSFRETVEYVFGSAWTITLNSQMLKAASDAMIARGVPWPKSRRSRMRRAAKSSKEDLLSESHVACVRL